MGVIQFIILAVVLGLIVWAIWKYLPIPLLIKQIILGVVVIVLVVLLLSSMGVLGHDIAIPRIH